jgi:DNA-binding MarR family transcriptional regulator
MKSSSTVKNETITTCAELQDIFMKFHKKISVALRREAKDVALTIPQLEALRFVIEQKGSTMNDVAKHLGVTAPSATVMIEHLYDKKLIGRRINPSDRRTIHVFPTLKATKLFSSFMKIKIRVLNTMFANLNNEDRKKLVVILKKIT